MLSLLFPSSPPPLLFPCIPLGNNKHLLHKAVLISEIADAMTEEFGHTKQDGGKSEAKQSKAWSSMNEACRPHRSGRERDYFSNWKQQAGCLFALKGGCGRQEVGARAMKVGDDKTGDLFHLARSQ